MADLARVLAWLVGVFLRRIWRAGHLFDPETTDRKTPDGKIPPGLLSWFTSLSRSPPMNTDDLSYSPLLDEQFALWREALGFAQAKSRARRPSANLAKSVAWVTGDQRLLFERARPSTGEENRKHKFREPDRPDSEPPRGAAWIKCSVGN